MYRYQVWGHHEALLAWNARASSKMRTAVVVVVFVGSRVGATSTRSIPTSPREEIRRTIARISLVVIPPVPGTPVPAEAHLEERPRVEKLLEPGQHLRLRH